MVAALTASLGAKKAFDKTRAAKQPQPVAVRVPPTMGAARPPVPEPLDPLDF